MEKKSEKYKNNENATEWSAGWFKRGTPVLATFSALFCSVLVHFPLGYVTNDRRPKSKRATVMFSCSDSVQVADSRVAKRQW